MKKTISIILAISLLLLCLSSCGPKYVTGDYFYTGEETVYTSSGSGLIIGYSDSLEEHENEFRKSDEYIFFKFTPVGGSVLQLLNDLYDISLLFTPVKITEIIECGEKNTLKVGDVVYYRENYTVIVEETIERYQQRADVHGDNITLKIGDYFAPLPIGTFCDLLMTGETYFAMSDGGFWLISDLLKNYETEIVADGYMLNETVFCLNPDKKPSDMGECGKNYVKVWEQVMAKYYKK